MKILMVSMNSIHFERWTDQLKDSGHDIFWFNIKDGNYSDKLSWVNQIIGWRYKFSRFRGRIFFKKRLPRLYKKFNVLFENDTARSFERILLEVKPDVVHSFVLYISCVPIFKVMKKYNEVKWIYSSWGSDLFYFQNDPIYLEDIKRVLPRVNYIFTDCKRDLVLAKKYGFNGKVLGVFPGGGGYPVKDFEPYIQPVKARNLILVKGYQGRSGRAITVLKALEKISEEIKAYFIIVFGADEEVEMFVKQSNLKDRVNLELYRKSNVLPQIEVIKLMGRALLYIGNSNSDGMPNTLLEAVIMGAFPIQSNPGNATAEILNHCENGMLINDCDDSEEIKTHIQATLGNKELLNNAFKINQTILKKQLERSIINQKVLASYNTIIT